VGEPLPLPTPQQLVTLRALLIPLSRVSALIVVLGLIAVVTAFVNAVFGFAGGIFAHIPFLNRVIAAPMHRVQQHTTEELRK